MVDTRTKVEKKGRKEEAVNSEGAWWSGGGSVEKKK